MSRPVNPDHLEPVSPRENMRRASAQVATKNESKTHCPKGHPYSGDNLYVNILGARECQVCRHRKFAESYERRKARLLVDKP